MQVVLCLENAKKASNGPGYLSSDRRLNDMRTTTQDNDVELMIFTVSRTCAALKWTDPHVLGTDPFFNAEISMG